jgi:hypothetical protein
MVGRLRVWMLMARGWWDAGSSRQGSWWRAKAIPRRMATVKIKGKVVDVRWGLCGMRRSNGGLWGLLAAPALVEFMRGFING